MPDPGLPTPADIGQLESITVADQLPPGVTLACDSERELRLVTPSPLGLDYHWAREVLTGVLRGATGLRLDASADAHISATFRGVFHATVTRDDVGGAPWLRLRLFRDCGNDMALDIHAQANLLATGEPKELVSALLGIHPLQWVRDALKEIGSTRWKQIAEKCGASCESMERLLNAWGGLGARAEAAIWKAADSAESLSHLSEWAAWVANDCPDAATFNARLQRELDGMPGFVNSPVGQWVESAAGAALSTMWSEQVFQRLQAAAKLVHGITSRAELPALLAKLQDLAGAELDPAKAAPWMLARLGEMLGRSPVAGDFEALTEKWKALAAKIQQAAGELLNKNLPLELKLQLEGASSDQALADASFPFDAEGLALYRRVLGGDLSPLFGTPDERVRLRSGNLTHHVHKTRHLEVHLPFMDRKSWQTSLDTVARAEVLASDDGRIFVDHLSAEDVIAKPPAFQSSMLFTGVFSARDGEPRNDNFSLRFTDRRVMGATDGLCAWGRVLEAYGLAWPALPSAPVTATLLVRIPGETVEVWCSAPHSRDPEFFPTMSNVSRTMQAALRRWLPALYLSDLDRYNEPSAVLPLLAYQSSPPYTGKRKGDFCYDAMDQTAVEKALMSSAPALTAVLAQTQSMLRAAGREHAAGFYDPAQAKYLLASTLRQRRNFCSLLVADAFFVEEVLHLADCARELSAVSRQNPKRALRNMSRYGAALVQTFHRKLRRLYAGEDFRALGSILLSEATMALCGRRGEPVELAATLTIESGGRTTLIANEAARRVGMI
jgi:hypothetical protein